MPLLILFFAAFIIYAVYKISVQESTAVLSNWHQLLTHVQLSSQEFYHMLEEAINEKELQRLNLTRTTRAEGGILSVRREYLRVQYKNYFFDICAAPYARDFFVSWWLSESEDPILKGLSRIPIIGAFFKKRPKTFYELDTENLFKELIRGCVTETIAQMTETKGFRMEREMSVQAMDTIQSTT